MEWNLGKTAIVISTIAIIISGSSLFINYQQYQLNQIINSPADVAVCLQDFNYELNQTYDSGRSATFSGTISFDLVNKGNNDVTVHRVDVFPRETSHDGDTTSMWFRLELQELVTAKGISSVEELVFESSRQYENRWVMEPEQVALMAFWPEGNGEYITCQLDVVSVKEGDWICGYPDGSGLLVENACR